MEDIIIVGAGGFGREVAWLLEGTRKYKILGYVDDDSTVEINDYKYLGDMSFLGVVKNRTAVVIALGNPKIRKKIYFLLKKNNKLYFPNIVDETALIGKRVEMGEGNIICANSVLTVDVKIKNCNLINLNTTIGHDVKMESFISIYPSVNVSGFVLLGSCIEIGTGSQIIPNVRIEKNVTLGAGSVVINDIVESSIAVGVPAKVKKVKG